MKAKLKLISRAMGIYRALPRPYLLSSALASLAAAIVPFINIYMSAQIINELVGYRRQDTLVFLVALTLGLNLAAALISWGLERWATYCEDDLWVQTWTPLVFKMLTMDYADVEDTRIQEKAETIRGHHMGMGFGIHAIAQSYRQIIDNTLRVILSVAFAFSLFTLRVPYGSPLVWLDSWWAVLGIIAILLCSILLSPFIASLGMRVYARASDLNSKGNRHFGFYFWTMTRKDRAKDIRIYAQQPVIDRESGEGFWTADWMKMSKSVDRYAAAGDVVAQLANAAIYLYVAAKALAGAFPVGGIVQYIGAIFQFGQGVSELVMQIGMQVNNLPYLEKFMDFVDMPNRKYMGTLPVEKRTDNKYQLEFKNVGFKYPGSESYALRGLNLKLQIGEKLAVVGMNGSGKTTMIKLLTRLYDPTEGEITLNGIDIKKYNYDEYMAIFGVVLQDFALLPFTLGQNVAASMEYDRERAEECLTAAGFAERLAELPHGTETFLDKRFDKEGIVPSGGEQQKIALARALYRNSPFIVLDEPTAALDPIAEYEIYTRFNAIVGDKTAVYISHRLSSCRFCDDIIVFHEGTAIQRGTHDTLLSDENGKYHELWHAQAQYYTE